ncbi:glycosyltransferase family protein [Teredinibacter purpureus]|uniref:hypothetical protein n=1 Tax=Teredinibacter purpureus TaxID=2731756 RepID=UPI0005F76978|nr:hypothetical protein [Teredinibacter purpureus]
MQKTLLITSTPAGSKGVGDIYLENICSQQPDGSIARLSVVKRSRLGKIKKWLNFSCYEYGVFKSHLPILSSLLLLIFRCIYRERIFRTIVEVINCEKVDKIWVVLSSPELIFLAESLLAKTEIPVYVTIWDSPVYLKGNLNLDPFTYRLVKKSFDFTLKGAENISVINEGMGAKLCSEYADKTFVIRNGIDSNEFQRGVIERRSIEKSKSIKIVFAGSIYAKREWNSFVSALKYMDFKVNNKNIQLVNFGRLPRFGVLRDKRIEFRGQVELEEVLDELSVSDIGYVPYWFSPKKAEVVETSFPGKVSAYIASSVKVLFHGPKNSSVVSFINKYKVGVNCTSLDRRALVEAIEVVSDMQVGDRALTEARESLSKRKMILSFGSFIQ